MTEGPRRPREEGFTLVEVLVALVILTVAVVLTVGVMTTLVVDSENQQGQSQADAGAKAYAEAMQYQAMNTPSINSGAPGTSYVTCPTATDLAPNSNYFASPNANYPNLTFSITQVEYWIPSTTNGSINPQVGSFTTSNSQCQTFYSTECPTAFSDPTPACAPGLERVTIQVTSSRTTRETNTQLIAMIRRGNATS